MIISIDTKKVFEKNSTSIHDKTQQSGYNKDQHNKDHL